MNSSAGSNYLARYLVAETGEGSQSEANPGFSAGDVATGLPFTKTIGTLRPALVARPSDTSLEPPQSDALRFSALFSAIDKYLSLPTGFFEAVDGETAEAAERVLAYLEASGRNAPKMFSHGGDSIVFTWDHLPLSMYLTISGADAAFLLVNELSKIQCPSTIVSLDSPDVSGLLGYIGSSQKAASNAE